MTTPGFSTGGQNIMSQFGMPLFGVSGMLPYTGNYFFVDETNGSDGNTGGPSDPLKTLTQALAKCTSGNNDVIFMTGSVHISASLAWSKSRTHLIGLSPPSQNSRARIAISNTAATSGAVSPLVNVTGAGCIFQNVESFNGINQAATQVTWKEDGGQSYYKNCNFIQTGHATAAAQAGSRALTVGSDENLFDGCTIGGDTNVRASGTNATMEFLPNSSSSLGAARNVFRNSVFQMLASAATDVHVTAGASSMDRYALFDACAFMQGVASGQSAATAAFTINASAGGFCSLNNCLTVGFGKVSASGPVYVNQISAAGGGTTAIGVLAS